MYTRPHFHSMTPLTPKAAATSTDVAIFDVTSCTAASRRPASSPAHVSPNRPPSGPSTRPTDGPMERARTGSSGKTGWLTRPILLRAEPVTK